MALVSRLYKMYITKIEFSSNSYKFLQPQWLPPDHYICDQPTMATGRVWPQPQRPIWSMCRCTMLYNSSSAINLGRVWLPQDDVQLHFKSWTQFSFSLSFLPPWTRPRASMFLSNPNVSFLPSTIQCVLFSHSQPLSWDLNYNTTEHSEAETVVMFESIGLTHCKL